MLLVSLLSLAAVAQGQLWWNASSCKPSLTNRAILSSTIKWTQNVDDDEINYVMPVYWPENSHYESTGLPVVAVLPDLGSTADAEVNTFRAQQLAQNGFIAYVVDYRGDFSLDTDLLGPGFPVYFENVLKGSMNTFNRGNWIPGDFVVQDYQSLMGFGYGAQLAWSMEYTNWQAPEATAIVATGIAPAALSVDLPQASVSRAYPFSVILTSDFGEENLRAFWGNASHKFESSTLPITYATATFAGTALGFANYGQDTYEACPGEMAFTNALAFTIRTLGPLHESFNAGSEQDVSGGDGIKASEYAPKGALIALGIMCALVVMCMLCYSYYPEDEIMDSDNTLHLESK